MRWCIVNYEGADARLNLKNVSGIHWEPWLIVHLYWLQNPIRRPIRLRRRLSKLWHHATLDSRRKPQETRAQFPLSKPSTRGKLRSRMRPQAWKVPSFPTICGSCHFEYRRMAEQEYRRAAQRSIRKQVGTCSCLAKEDRAVHKPISIQDVLTRPPHIQSHLTAPSPMLFVACVDSVST